MLPTQARRIFAISPSAYYGRIAHYYPDLQDRLDAFTDRIVDLLEGVAAKAEAAGVSLVLGNEYWSVFRGERVLPLLDRLPTQVKLDVDTAHLTIAGIDPTAFLIAQHERIGCVHLTDTAFVDDGETWQTPNPAFPEHRATQVFRDPGAGNVDLTGIVDLLRQTGQAGRLCAAPVRRAIRSWRCCARARFLTISRSKPAGVSAMPNIRYTDILPLFGAREAFTAFAGEPGVEVIDMFHSARLEPGG